MLVKLTPGVTSYIVNPKMIVSGNAAYSKENHLRTQQAISSGEAMMSSTI